MIKQAKGDIPLIAEVSRNILKYICTYILITQFLIKLRVEFLTFTFSDSITRPVINLYQIKTGFPQFYKQHK